MRTKQSRIIAAALLTILAASLVFAQGAMGTGPAGQTTKGAVIKGKAPVNKNESHTAGEPQGANLHHAAGGIEWRSC